MEIDSRRAEMPIRTARGWEWRRDRSVKAPKHRAQQPGRGASYLLSRVLVSTQGPSTMLPSQQSSKSRLLTEWFQWPFLNIFCKLAECYTTFGGRPIWSAVWRRRLHKVLDLNQRQSCRRSWHTAHKPVVVSRHCLTENINSNGWLKGEGFRE